MKAACQYLCLLLEVVRRLFDVPFLLSMVSVVSTGEPTLPEVGLPALGWASLSKRSCTGNNLSGQGSSSGLLEGLTSKVVT